MKKPWQKTLAVLACAIFLAAPAFASTQEDFLKARTEYLCSWMAAAAYKDRLGTLAADELTQRGWQIEQKTEKNDTSKAKFHIATRSRDGWQTTLVAIAGTTDLKDVKSDLRMGSVPYDGEADARRVHKGFDDYTTTLLDSTYQGRSASDVLTAAAKRSKGSLIVTGHSLGGAVATLVGSRIVDNGGSRVFVVSFGAPAVGNSAYNASYANAIHLDRVVMAGDPVPSSLQSVSKTYEQPLRETKWTDADDSRRFAHNMVVYIDAALRNYYDAREAYSRELGHDIIERTTAKRTVNLYVAPPVFDLSDELGPDQRYMEAASNDYLRDYFHGLVFARQDVRSFNEVLEEARRAGCQFVLMRTFRGIRAKHKEYDFTMTLEEEIFDTSGTLLSGQTYTTHTEDMTPIEATLYLTALGQRNRVLVH